MLAEEVDSSRVESNVRLVVGEPVATTPMWRWLALAGLAAALLLGVFLMRARPVYAAAAKDHRLEIIELRPRQWSMDRASIAALAQREGSLVPPTLCMPML